MDIAIYTEKVEGAVCVAVGGGQIIARSIEVVLTIVMLNCIR